MTDRRPALGMALVAALLGILGAYYYVHKPIAPGQAAALVAAAADLAVAGVLTLLAGAAGHRILRGWTLASPGERAAVHAALGWGVMGLGMLGLGVAGLFYGRALWVIVLVGLAVLQSDLRGWLRDVGHSLRALWRPGDSRLAALALWMALIVLTLGLLRALAPPLKWDALVYHLALPKLYAQLHGARPQTDFFFVGMPQLAEMLYTAAVLLRGPLAAQTLGWAFGAVLALGLAAHADDLVGPRLGPLASAILFSSFTVSISLAWAYVDLLLMLHALAVLVALRRWRFERRDHWLWLGGIMAGLALGSKYTGGIVPLAGLAIILLPSSSARLPGTGRASASARGRRLRFAVVFLGTAFVTFAPWLLKNWLYSGSPIYPLLFPAGDVDALRQWFYNRPDLISRNPFWAAAIFFRGVFLGVEGGNDYDATLGPLFVFLPLALGLSWRRLTPELRAELRPLLAFTLAGYAGWVGLTYLSAFGVQPRLFFGILPALILLSVAGAAGLSALDTPSLRISMVVSAALALILGLSTLEVAAHFVRQNPLPYLWGDQRAADYRAANLGWYAVALERVNALPDGSRVMFLWEARSLECALPERCLPDVIIDRWWHLRRTVGSADAILARWRAEGITHVLIYDTGVEFIRAEADNGFEEADWAALQQLRARLRRLEDLGGAYTLYEMP